MQNVTMHGFLKIYIILNMQDTLIVEEREINAHGSRRTVGGEEVGLYFGPLLGRCGRITTPSFIILL